MEIINLLLYGHGGEKGWDLNWMLEDYISRGCPNLKSFALESLDLFGDSKQFIKIDPSSGLKSLQSCKELKNLKFKKIGFFQNWYSDWHSCDESDLKNMFPNCYVDLKKCGKLEYFWNGCFSFMPFDHSNCDVLDNFEGEEIRLMFSQNYGY